jgi:hypothetical protein
VRSPSSHSFAARLALVLVGGLVVAGCDAGGLLVVEGKPSNGPPVQPVVVAGSSSELVASGTVAKNDRYKVVFTTGQPTPQSVAKSSTGRVNGGVVGAVSDR